MQSPTSRFGLGSEFDDFLFASVAEDRNGMSLSVVSLLGRMDLDPWQEALSLAGLPAEAATQRLTSLIGLLPDPLPQLTDARSLAARLIALLPGRADTTTRALQASVSGDATTTQARPITNWMLLAIYLTVMLVTQFVIGYFGPARVDVTHTPPSSSAPSQTPPPATIR